MYSITNYKFGICNIILFLLISFSISYSQTWLYPNSVYWYHLADVPDSVRSIVSDSISVRGNVKDFVNVLDKGADSTGATSSSQAFQDAFDTAKDSGYVGVIVPKGTYEVRNVRIHEGLILLLQNATLQSTGSASDPSVVSRRDTTRALFHFYGSANNDRAKGLTIIGGTLKQEKTELMGSENIEDFADGTDVLNLWDAEQIEIRNVSFSLSTRSNIMARNVHNMNISNSTFSASSGPAIYLVGGANITVENDTFTTVQNAVKAPPDTANSKVVENLKFSNNRVESFKHGLYLAAPRGLEVSHNYFIPDAVTNFDGDSTGAIWIATSIDVGGTPPANEVRNVHIYKNYIKDFAVAGNNSIFFDEIATQTIGENIKIESNQFENNVLTTIFAEFDVDILNNDVVSVSTDGSETIVFRLNIQNGSDLGKSSQVSGNRIYNTTTTDDGINVTGTSYFRIFGNYLRNCDIDFAPTDGYEGVVSGNSIQSGQILIAGNTNSTISGNVIETNTDHAIEFTSSGDNVSVIGNRITMTAAFAGIHLPQGCSNNVLCSNTIRSGDVGIEIDNSSNHEVCHNTVDDATTYAIQASESGGGSADNITISFNFVDGSTGDIDISGAGSGNLDTLNVSIP